MGTKFKDFENCDLDLCPSHLNMVLNILYIAGLHYTEQVWSKFTHRAVSFLGQMENGQGDKQGRVYIM